ncbi:MAG TPA: hypothetical protein VLB27_06275 [candidate division Zixibacteria bacterium]|nr:hypothetical protein [candidate division Zixibacteria bacterium]
MGRTHSLSNFSTWIALHCAPLALLLLTAAPSATAQGALADVQAGVDPGVPDTVYVSNVDVNAGDVFSVTVSVTNDEGLAGATLGFGWGTSDLTLDSVSYSGTRLGGLPAAQTPFTIDNTAHTGLFGFFVFFPPGILPGSGSFAKLWFTADAGAPDQFIDLDSTFVPPSGEFILVAIDGNISFGPQFVGGRVKIGNPSEPPTIEVAPDSFYFSAEAGPINPPARALSITNIGLGTLKWSASWSSGWLGVAPSSGVAPSLSQITANSVGLPAGLYYDTIVVSDPLATNNPVEIPVTLEVKLPPPTISLSQTSFFFNAIADSSNPPSQTLTITNTGGSPLNWSATHTEAWLDITPEFGGDLTDMTLSIDITGLPFGAYLDTIVISDPNANNSPRKVAVSLSIASDLPIMRLEPDTLTVVVDVNGAPQRGDALVFDTAYFDILNDGAGLMNFTTFENSSRILTTTPDSGAAPATVELVLRFGNPVPGEIYDTLWVNSPQAINSPQMLILRYHLTATPANIIAQPDTLKFIQYECEQGLSYIPQVRTLTLQNFGEPAPYTISEEIDWLQASNLSGIAPTSVHFAQKLVDYPIGEYLDSIRIDAPFSETNPVWVMTRLSMVPGNKTPVVVPNGTLFVISARENSSFQYAPLQILTLHNFQPGCFSWEIIESIPWLNPYPTSGINPGVSVLLADGTGYVFGEYPDHFQTISPEASNSPVEIDVKMRVWRLFGDADYDNRVLITDVAYLLAYIFNSGPGPEPEIFVGDTDCNGVVNVADVTRILEYIFNHGNICGNESF